MKLKRIAAVIGVVLLVAMYAAAFISAALNRPDSGRLLMAAVVCTVFIPVLIHLLMMMNNVRKGKGLYDEPYSYREDKEKEKNNDIT